MKLSRDQHGQSTVEFIFAFAFGVSVILLVFNSAMNHISGYLVHYATFMASRTYLVHDSFLGNYSAEASLSGGDVEARKVFAGYNLGIFGVNPNDFHINTPTGKPQSEYYQVGAYTKFMKDIDVLGKITGQKKVILISESFLGKEPTRNICAMRVCKAITNSENGCSGSLDITLFDDGC